MRILLQRLAALATDFFLRIILLTASLTQPVSLTEGFDRVLRQTQCTGDRRIAHSLRTILRDQQLFSPCHLASSGDLQSLHRVRHRQLHIDAFSDQIVHMVIKRVWFQNAPDSPLTLVIDKHLLEIAE